MSGLAPPLRSPWFGDALTWATTQESGRNSDTNSTMTRNTDMFDGPAWRNAQTKNAEGGSLTLTIVQKAEVHHKHGTEPRRPNAAEFWRAVAAPPHRLWITHALFRLCP